MAWLKNELSSPVSPAQGPRGRVAAVRDRVWGHTIETVMLPVNEGTPVQMNAVDDCTWTAPRDTPAGPPGSHVPTVAADRISVDVNQQGGCRERERKNK